MTAKNVAAAEVLRLLRSGKPTVGAWLSLGSAATAEILARSGFDWLMIDMEHGLGGFSELVSQLRAIDGLGPLALVRSPWNDLVQIKRILDAGAAGILVPYVNSLAEAQHAVAACTYPPIGRRGAATSTRAAHQGQSPSYFAESDERILILVQVETVDAVRRIDDILAVPRIDGVFVGPVDLSASMGHLGDRHHPDVQEAIASVERRVLDSGKILGTISASWSDAEALYRRGYTFVSLMADGVSLATEAREAIQRFSNAFPDRSPQTAA